MQDFENKTAFVTGAASGIGFALASAFAREGAQVMMADINAELLEDAATKIRAENGKVDTIICDVTQIEDVRAAADKTQDVFGDVHIVMNNAGVALAGEPGNIDIKDWQWIVDINLMGVVNGVETFVPRMKAHGQGAYIVNTASMAGHMTLPTMGPYHATKFAVVGYSEALQQELFRNKIGVSVLCPTWVKSKIFDTSNQRPTAADGPDLTESPAYHITKSLVENGMDADKLAALVLASIRAKRFYIFNDPEVRSVIDQRRDNILADYDACLADLENL